MKRLALVVAVALLVGACGTAEPGASTTFESTTSMTPSSAAPSTFAPSTTLSSTTSQSPATTAPTWPETWLAIYRRDFPGYAVELIEVTTGERIVVPTDRRKPYPGNVFSDGRGGLLIGEPPGHLAADELHPAPFGHEDAWLQAVVDVDGAATALSVLVEGSSGWEDQVIVNDVDITLLASQLGQEPITVIRTHVSSRIDYPTGTGEQEGAWLQRVAYGGGILGLLWTRLGNCAWLELQTGFSGEPAEVVNPWPDEQCDEMYGGLLDIALTADGRFLVAQVFPSVAPSLGGPDLVMWDLRTGHEVDRLPGAMSFLHDGDRGLAVDRRTNGNDIELALARITDTGFEVTTRPDLQGGVGLIAGPLTLAEGATLAPAERWTDCSAAAAAELAEQTGLTAAAADTREAITDAIRSCDLEMLAEVAISSPGFALADGGATCDEPWPMSVEHDDPVGYWYRGDVNFNELQVMLDTLAGAFTVGQDGRYIWTDQYGYRIEIGTDGAWLLDWRDFLQPPCEAMECTC